VKQVRRPLSTGLPATSFDNLDSYTLVEHGGLYHHLPPTSQPWKGTMHSPISPYPSTTLAYIETTQIPLSPWPYGSIGKELGHTWRHDEPPSQLSSNSDYMLYDCLSIKLVSYSHDTNSALVHISRSKDNNYTLVHKYDYNKVKTWLWKNPYWYSYQESLLPRSQAF